MKKEKCRDLGSYLHSHWKDVVVMELAKVVEVTVSFCGTDEEYLKFIEAVEEAGGIVMKSHLV